VKRATAILMAVAWSVSALAAAPSFSAKLSAERKILHALSRLTFGARPGDIDRVRVMGLEKWIDLQLHPERIEENPVLEVKLRPLEVLRMSSSQVRQTYPVDFIVRAMAEGRAPYPADPEHRRALEFADAIHTKRGQRQPGQGDSEAQLAKLLEPDQVRILRAGTAREKLALLGSLREDRRNEILDALPGTDREKYKAVLAHGSPEFRRKILHPWLPHYVTGHDLVEGKLSRAIYGNRQLKEVLADFWFNHFNVTLEKVASRVPSYERDAIGPRVLGKFKDLLRATAEHSAMLQYLDNYRSVDPKAFARMERRAEPYEPRGLNENYARELLELHTLGVDGGYTQQDIIEVARCFTGWTFRGERRRPGERFEFDAWTFTFEFKAEMHDPDEKTVLGVKISAGGGIEDGLKVLDILSRHPSTARYISRRLAQRFLSDDPPASVVQKMAQTFTQTEGDIREVLKTMLSTPEFWSEGAYQAKIKSPLEMMVSAVRALDAEVEFALGLAFKIEDLGQPLYQKREPIGYSNTSEEWVNSTALLARMNFAPALASNSIAGVHVDLRRLDHTQPPDPLRVAKALLPGGVSQQTRAAIANASSSSQVVGLILGSPDFQRR